MSSPHVLTFDPLGEAEHLGSDQRKVLRIFARILFFAATAAFISEATIAFAAPQSGVVRRLGIQVARQDRNLPPQRFPDSETPQNQLPTPQADGTGEKDPPPAWGPGSASYGQSFFYNPGQENAGAATLNPPQESNLGAPVEMLPAPPSNSTSPLPNASSVAPSGEPFRADWQAPLDVGANTNGWVFNFQDAPWSVVLKNFARFSEMSLIIDQQPTGQLTYYDERPYSFVEALDVLNDHLQRQGMLLVRNERKLTVISRGTGFRDGVVPFVPLSAIDLLGRNELVSVAFPLSANASPNIVLEVQQLLSPMGSVMALSNSGRIVVTDVGASLRRLRDLLSGSGLAADDVTTVVIHLRNTKANEIAAAVNQRLGQGGPSAAQSPVMQVSGLSASGGGFAGSGSGLGGSSGTMGSVGLVPEAVTNSLLMQGTPEELAKMQALVTELDRDPGQVMIQALLVEVLLGNTDEFGVELGLQDSVLFNRSVIDNVVSLTQTNTNPNGVQTTDQTIISQTAAPGFNFNGAPLGNNVTVRPSSLGQQAVSNFGLGRVNAGLGFGGLVLSASSNSVNVLLRALSEKHKLEVLSRPHVRTVNNHEALIQIGQQVPIVDGVTISPNGIANPVVRQDKAGIILRVTPRIADGGMVQIDVQAEKSAYQLIPGSGVPIFTDANSGSVIEAPVKDITTAQTTVTAMSGQTIVLGGMITRDDSTVERKVPVLGDIPVMGRLFRHDFKQTNRKELLIFLTPTIVNTASESDCMATEEADRISIHPRPSIDLHQDFMKARNQGQELAPTFDSSLQGGLIE